MGVPFETLVPYGIIFALFGVTGFGLSTIKHFTNDRKGPRRGLDGWDKQMMNRDLRLTGKLRGQTDKPVAPPGFEVNNPWRVEPKYY